MDKKEITEALCALCTEVNKRAFKYNKAADCFCVVNSVSNFQFEREVFDFIAVAVHKELDKLS